MRSGKRHTGAALMFDDIAPFELSVACEVFGLDRSDLGVPWYRFFVVAPGDAPVRTSVGFTIDTPYRLADLRGADTIVVPARADGESELDCPEPVLDALRAAHKRGALSPRTFARRFRATTGTTPMQWVLRQRVLLAQRLLETSDEPVDRVAELAGFGSPAALRQHFQRLVRTSPTAYRRTFRQEEPVP